MVHTGQVVGWNVPLASFIEGAGGSPSTTTHTESCVYPRCLPGAAGQVRTPGQTAYVVVYDNHEPVARLAARNEQLIRVFDRIRRTGTKVGSE